MNPSGEEFDIRPYSDIIKRLTRQDAITLSAIDKFHYLLPHYNDKIKTEIEIYIKSNAMLGNSDFAEMGRIANKWASIFTKEVLGLYEQVPDEFRQQAIENLVHAGLVVRLDFGISGNTATISPRNLLTEVRGSREVKLDPAKTAQLLADLVKAQRSTQGLEALPTSAFIVQGEKINCIFNLTKLSARLMDICREIPNIP